MQWSGNGLPNATAGATFLLTMSMCCVADLQTLPEQIVIWVRDVDRIPGISVHAKTDGKGGFWSCCRVLDCINLKGPRSTAGTYK